jgi:hypothetical protein
MFVCCECCVLPGRGLCDELITHPEESYRLRWVVMCDLENLKNEEAMTRVGSQRHRGNKLRLHVFICLHFTCVCIRHIADEEKVCIAPCHVLLTLVRFQ